MFLCLAGARALGPRLVAGAPVRAMPEELQQTLDDGRVEYNAPAQSERQYVPNRVRSMIRSSVA